MSHPEYKHIGNVLIRTIEECSELIKSLCKIERFGIGSRHPETNTPNILKVEDEIKDVLDCIIELQEKIITFNKENTTH